MVETVQKELDYGGGLGVHKGPTYKINDGGKNREHPSPLLGHRISMYVNPGNAGSAYYIFLYL